MRTMLKVQYGFDVWRMEKAQEGAGSDTWFVECEQGKFVVKYPCESEINHPEREPQLCEFLCKAGLPVCEFVKNVQGEFLSRDEQGRLFHVQKFIEGKVYEWNEAPDRLLKEAAEMLGRIHTALKEYKDLPVGIGADFFRYMTPENALGSYQKSLQIALEKEDAEVVEDLQYRIGLMKRFPKYQFDLEKLTCQATHGDYFISQWICGEEKIEAVIDWTTACIHPVIWEIIRSYVYAASECKEGQIHVANLVEYVREYCKFATLNAYDLECMVPLFYYQLAVCDYYGQYYGSDAANRHIYLRQAKFSTKLLRWFEKHGEETSKVLKGEIHVHIHF